MNDVKTKIQWEREQKPPFCPQEIHAMLVIFSIFLQLESNQSICVIEMESHGDVLVPMKSAVFFEGSCRDLHIQVVGQLPDTVAQWNKENNFGSFRPYLRVKTMQPGQLELSELSKTDTKNFSKFSSIQDALDASPAWGTILIPEGHYYESLLITKPVKLIGNARTVLFGSIQVVSHDVTLDEVSVYSLDVLKPTLEVTSSSNVVFHNCRLEQGKYSNSNLLMRKTHAVRVVNSSSIYFVNCRVVDFGIGFEIWNSSKCVIQSNWIQSCWTALRVSGSENIRVVRNYMKENMILVSQKNQSDVQHLLHSLVSKNILEDNVRLTDEHETETRKIFINSVQSKPLQELKIDTTVIVTGSCYSETLELEPCAHYRTGR